MGLSDIGHHLLPLRPATSIDDRKPQGMLVTRQAQHAGPYGGPGWGRYEPAIRPVPGERGHSGQYRLAVDFAA